MIKPLSELRPHERGTIVGVGGSGSIHHRVLDMGIVIGSEVEVERMAPLGDPIAIKIKDYHLSLRKEEAANVLVDVLRAGKGAVLPLSIAPPGRPLQVLSVNAGWGLTRRLFALGVVPGVRVRVLEARRLGRILVEVGGVRVPLGHRMAERVLVMELS